MLQFITEDEIKISVRPSGTEPKIKFYFTMNEHINNVNEIEYVTKELDEDLGLLAKSLTTPKETSGE